MDPGPQDVIDSKRIGIGKILSIGIYRSNYALFLMFVLLAADYNTDVGLLCRAMYFQ